MSLPVPHFFFAGLLSSFPLQFATVVLAVPFGIDASCALWEGPAWPSRCYVSLDAWAAVLWSSCEASFYTGVVPLQLARRGVYIDRTVTKVVPFIVFLNTLVRTTRLACLSRRRARPPLSSSRRRTMPAAHQPRVGELHWVVLQVLHWLQILVRGFVALQMRALVLGELVSGSHTHGGRSSSESDTTGDLASGGTDGDGVTANANVYDTVSNEWAKVASLPVGRVHFQMSVLGGIVCNV